MGSFLILNIIIIFMIISTKVHAGPGAFAAGNQACHMACLAAAAGGWVTYLACIAGCVTGLFVVPF